jgi:hypothetical protein
MLRELSYKAAQGDSSMSGLTMGWLSRGESIALGWTLLHFCWQGAAVALTFAFADRLTMRASSAVRYGVATGALALMPVLVLATFAREMKLQLRPTSSQQSRRKHS